MYMFSQALSRYQCANAIELTRILSVPFLCRFCAVQHALSCKRLASTRPITAHRHFSTATARRLERSVCNDLPKGWRRTSHGLEPLLQKRSQPAARRTETHSAGFAACRRCHGSPEHATRRGLAARVDGNMLPRPRAVAARGTLSPRSSEGHGQVRGDTLRLIMTLSRYTAPGWARRLRRRLQTRGAGCAPEFDRLRHAQQASRQAEAPVAGALGPDAVKDRRKGPFDRPGSDLHTCGATSRQFQGAACARRT